MLIYRNTFTFYMVMFFSFEIESLHEAQARLELGSSCLVLLGACCDYSLGLMFNLSPDFISWNLAQTLLDNAFYILIFKC